jgi:hypothetical protein
MTAVKTDTDEQAVIVKYRLDDDGFGSTEARAAALDLEDNLATAIEASRAGEYDGHEVGDGWVTFYMYGTNADQLFKTAMEALRGISLPKGSHALRRYGKPGSREVRLEL